MNYLACSLCAFAFCGSFQADAVSFGCGIVMGLLLVVSLLLLQYNLSHNGVVLSSLFSRLGVGVPILLSILLFHEMPSMLQWIGICLAAAAIIFLNRKKEEQLSFHFSLLLLLLCNGTPDTPDITAVVYCTTGRALDWSPRLSAETDSPVPVEGVDDFSQHPTPGAAS